MAFDQISRPPVGLTANGLKSKSDKPLMEAADPRTIHEQPPYSAQKQGPPGCEEDMIPKVNHGEFTYVESGRLD
jgi:hypothetical protein